MAGELCFDALSGTLGYCVGGSGGAGGGFVAVEAVYVGKHGNDAAAGTDYATAKLTFAAAIAAAAAGAPSSSNQYVIVCEDAGRYVETGLNLPTYVHIHAPDAELYVNGGTGLTVGNFSSVRFRALYVVAGVGIAQVGGTLWVHGELMQAAGSADLLTQTGNSTTYVHCDQLACTNGNGLLVQSITPHVKAVLGVLIVAGSGVGVNVAGGGSFAGTTNIDVGHVRLYTSTATAFRQQLAGNGLIVRAGAIRGEPGVVAGTLAFNLNSGRIVAIVGDLNVATVVNSGPGTELDLFVGKMTGAVTGAGTHNITEAGKFPNPAGYVHGFDLRWTGVSTGTVGTGGLLSSCRDSTDTFDIEVSGTLAFNITVSGANGLQSGQVEAPNTWYEVHAIADSTGVNPVACLLIPFGVAFSQAGYDKHRRVGWVRNDGSSNLRKFLAVGLGSLRWYWWDDDASDLTFLAGGTATSWTTVSCAAFAPPNAEQLEIRYDYAPANTFDDFGIRPVGAASTSRANTPFNIQPVIDAQTEGQSLRAQMPGLCNSSQQMQYETQSGGPLSLQVIAFLDEV